MFYKGRKNLYSNTSKVSISGIYINEDITPYRQKLYFDARQLRKRGEIHSVWTHHGSIVLKICEQDIPTSIKNHRDLVELLKNKTIVEVKEQDLAKQASN